MTTHRKWGSDAPENSAPATMDERVARLERDAARLADHATRLEALEQRAAWRERILIAALVAISALGTLAGILALYRSGP